jgi:hypothetical protein
VKGKMITFTVKVTDTSSGLPISHGNVAWSDGGAGGSFSTLSCTLSSSGSTIGTCMVTYTAPGTPSSVTITATYSGDKTHAPSSGTSSLTVHS